MAKAFCEFVHEQHGWGLKVNDVVPFVARSLRGVRLPDAFHVGNHHVWCSSKEGTRCTCLHGCYGERWMQYADESLLDLSPVRPGLHATRLYGDMNLAEFMQHMDFMEAQALRDFSRS